MRTLCCFVSDEDWWRIWIVLYWVCIFQSLSCCESMSEPVKRNSTRERKPNRFLLPEDSEVVNYNGARMADQRETRTNASETNQLAKLFLTFLQSINTMWRDYSQMRTSPPNPTNHPPNHYQYHPHRATRTAEGSVPGADSSAGEGGRRGESRRTGYDDNSKTASKGGERKKGETGKQPNLQNANLNQDQTNLPTTTPRHKPTTQTDPTNPQNKPHPTKNGPDKDKKKSTPALQTRGQLKPFKRQSYHVAIAYHIHLKKVRPNANSNTNEIDPTYHARKLRDQQERQ